MKVVYVFKSYGVCNKVFIFLISKSIMEKEVRELINKSKQHAKEHGFRLNPNKEIVEGVIKGLLKNKQKHGEIYCPCRVVTGNKEKDKDIICPCIFHEAEIKKDNKCLCGLFVR